MPSHLSSALQRDSSDPSEVQAAVQRGVDVVGRAYARAAAAAAAPSQPASAAPPASAALATSLLRGHVAASWEAVAALMDGTAQARRRHPLMPRFADPAALTLLLLFTLPPLGVAAGVVIGLVIGGLCIGDPGSYRCRTSGEGAAVVAGAFLCMGA